MRNFNLEAYNTLTAKVAQAEAIAHFIQADFQHGFEFSLNGELANNALWSLCELLNQAQEAIQQISQSRNLEQGGNNA